MSSILFNNFKKRFLSGNVPSADDWYFIPVNSVFKTTYDTDKMPLEQYRNVDDFMKTDSAVFYYTSPTAATTYNHNQMSSISADNFNYNISSMSGEGLLSGNILEKTWRKVLNDETLSNKPMFINSANFENFKEYYYSTISANINSITEYINSGGFYYIRSKDELTWFANRSNKYNNRLIGVLGDSIEGNINGDPIGVDEKYPFEGILDGNGYALKNIELECSYSDNGIVGILGKFGEVKNFIISVDAYLNCNKKLNLNYLKTDARDINAGVLVGRNYGKIYNIKATPTLYLNGFIPEVYSVTNKSDDYTWSDEKIRQKWSNGSENFYFLNSWCINSPGNICPYIGYFAEGYYGEDMWAATRYLQDNNPNNNLPLSAGWSLESTTAKKFDLLDDILYDFNNSNVNGIYYVPLNAYNRANNNYYGFGIGGEYSASIYSDTANPEPLKTAILNLCKLPVYMGVDKDMNYTTCILNNTLNKHKTSGHYDTEFWPNTVTAFKDAFGGSNICYNANIIKNVYKDKINKALDYENSTTDTSSYFPYCPSAYCQTSLRMSPMVRAAYNIGCIAGANYGTISSVYLQIKVENKTNFVGFIGGIAGKQARGKLLKVHASTDYQLNYKPQENDNSYQVVYKQTPLLPKNYKPSYYVTGSTTADSLESCNADLLFSSFYDKDPTVDINKDITDDCIVYKLKPIFIAGGLFGRYIPNLEFGFEDNTSLDYIPAGCTISSCDIITFSNYGSILTGANSADISLENAFGAVVGKIDYESSNVDINSTLLQQEGLRIYDSHISAYGNFGENVVLKPYKMVTATGKNNQTYQTYEYEKTSYADGSRRYVGIYELKYNPCNSIALATKDRNIPYYTTYTVDPGTESVTSTISSISSNIEPSSVQDKLKGDDTGYLFVADLPFMTNYASGGPGASFWANWNFTSSMMPGFETNVGLNIPYGLNKRNVAHELVTISSCTSNITPLIVLYDDFFNTWGDEDPDSYNNLSLNIAHTKKWNKRYLYGNTGINLGLANSYATTKFKFDAAEYDGKGMIDNVYCDVYKLLPYTATNGSLSCMTFNSGYDLNGMEVAGIQNTFDGYTFIRTETQPAYAPDKQLQNVILNTTEFDKFYEYAILDEKDNLYHNPRIFEKNKFYYKSTYLFPYNYENKERYYMGEQAGTDIITNPTLVYSTDIQLYDYSYFINSDILSHEQETDKYFYYTYDLTNSSTITYDTLQDIETNGLIGKHHVEFTVNAGKLYYSLEGVHSKEQYTVGDYLSPFEIRDLLNKEDSFTTTSVSSEQNFAGLLVVDSSGRNIMFMDNLNNVPLTGNSVSFNITNESNNDNMNILEVK